jgi:para-nitrobenzyl esterase
MKTLWLWETLVVAALLCVRPAVAQIGIVSVTGGRVEGVTADGVTSFKGIPFAAPPVGNLRWRAPQPVRLWKGIKKADRFAPECIQASSFQPGAPPTGNEDCLYLNVWTPAKTAHERLPVVMWIYGGGFTGGSPNQPGYDGTHLARKGVVLVSIAYRLGAFGFLADPELSVESPHHLSGNYGLLDLIAGLTWVKRNIAEFGGDPSRVTIWGQSSGGDAVSLLAVSPLARGPFQRALSESGGIAFSPPKRGDYWFSPGPGVPTLAYPSVPALRSLAFAEAAGQHFLTKLGAPNIAAARALAADVIQKAADREPFDEFWPIFDGAVLPDDGYELYQTRRFNDTPTLIGTNADEGGIFSSLVTTSAQFESRIRAAFGRYASAILAVYPHATNAEAEQGARDFWRDLTFARNTREWAVLQSEKGRGKAYLYYFDRHHSPLEPLGPIHAAELVYVFGNLTASRRQSPPGPADVTFSRQIQSYWVNFAKTGNPNGPGLPHWPAFTVRSQRVMYLDAHPHVGPVPNLKKLEVLDAYFRSLREQAKKKPAN